MLEFSSELWFISRIFTIFVTCKAWMPRLSAFFAVKML